MGSQTQSQELHVVDFTDENTKKPGTDAWLSACSVVRTALEDNGFFMARYDKVGKELCDSVVSAVEELFDLPVETKAQKTSEKLFHGYLGQVSWLPLYESVGIDDPLTLLGCQKFGHIMWPEGNHRFCESINEYSKLLGELDHMAKRMVFESYGVDMQRCDSFIESNDYLLRCMMYRTPQTGENDLGLQPHSDLTITSIVHQLNNLNGLEIKLKDGEWKGIDASPSSFVVMAGDAFLTLGKAQEALLCFDRAIQINPNFADVHFNKATALCKLGKFEEAILSFDKAIEINPNHGDFYTNKGVALASSGKLEESLLCFDKAVQIDPTNEHYQFARAMTLKLLGKTKSETE